jgi:hypothetical protein
MNPVPWPRVITQLQVATSSSRDLASWPATASHPFVDDELAALRSQLVAVEQGLGKLAEQIRSSSPSTPDP